jgi:hypothetical protein
LWDAEGRLLCDGSYENDAPAGEWSYYLDDLVYRRFQYDREGGTEVERRYDLGRLAERRVTSFATESVELTAWHSNGKRRLEGILVKGRPQGRWRWWDSEGHQIRDAAFRDGVPQDLAGIPAAERFFGADIGLNFQGVPLRVYLDLLRTFGIRTRIECPEDELEDISNREVSATGDLGGAIDFYLALRDVGLRMDARVEKDGTDVLVVMPAKSD